ncbi:putative lipopolysaccharide biosynthesis protein [Campylobacter sputorum subsp. bubulus]|uniref:Putative lipopolysaccharide biosynthesis protein n=1 Tax=Campylobacter sputorum subsp. sputorum TaxID=32024 RepID=A0A381DHB2_9BACT|nr:hypothetical protein [Campylobacter sputorum]SUX08888.1 putative lipopolysaccharide biosynthesis protein [Campylobacter sputorum subsp. bubulus]SUX09870.1 putative lipopolysaccharide biosynthesis protein [Campylobacter sputorum subsp. sputorum]
MKIIHILYLTEFAGTEKVCVDLCNEMSKKMKCIYYVIKMVLMAKLLLII